MPLGSFDGRTNNMQKSEVKSIKVLAIDGGGIRGIIPSIILGKLRAMLGADLHEVFDLIAGTSTGGIIALGIATRCKGDQPYSPDELVDLYVRNGPAIFRKTWFTPVRQLFRPKYLPTGLEEALHAFFRETTFSTALTPLLISSYELESQLPFFFKSHRIADKREHDWKVTTIARATSAAPTFFPPLHITRGGNGHTLVDGGVFVNNPAMAAYAEARRLYPNATDFLVAAVGTGDRQDHIHYSSARKWGLLRWAKQIVPVFMDSVSEAVDYELRWILKCKYYRLQVLDLSPASNEMDDVTPANLANLQAVAREYVQRESKTLKELCSELKAGRGSDMPGIGRKSA
jgi:patatin-like phospholipase/acyl hydrolase